MMSKIYKTKEELSANSIIHVPMQSHNYNYIHMYRCQKRRETSTARSLTPILKLVFAERYVNMKCK